MSQVKFDEEWVDGRNGLCVADYAFVPSVCRWLTEDGLCKIHDGKPEYCAGYPENIGRQPWMELMGCRYWEDDS